MTKLKSLSAFKTVAAAALLSGFVVAPAFAQAAMSHPDAFEAEYPDRDPLNGGALTPEGRLDSLPSAEYNTPAATDAIDSTSCAQHYRSYDPTTGTFRGYDGRRHSCE
jgi:hypothetical protein